MTRRMKIHQLRGGDILFNLDEMMMAPTQKRLDRMAHLGLSRYSGG